METPAPESRIVRCEVCGGFLLRVQILSCAPGSAVMLGINTNCRNRACKCENEFQVAVNDTIKEGKLAANRPEKK